MNYEIEQLNTYCTPPTGIKEHWLEALVGSALVYSTMQDCACRHHAGILLPGLLPALM